MWQSTNSNPHSHPFWYSWAINHRLHHSDLIIKPPSLNPSCHSLTSQSGGRNLWPACCEVGSNYEEVPPNSTYITYIFAGQYVQVVKCTAYAVTYLIIYCPFAEHIALICSPLFSTQFIVPQPWRGWLQSSRPYLKCLMMSHGFRAMM